MNTAQDPEIKRLRWCCRRGMRELDQLLERWLDQQFAAASESDRGVFRRLLDCEDDRIWRWFLGHETSPDVEIAALVDCIRRL